MVVVVEVAIEVAVEVAVVVAVAVDAQSIRFSRCAATLRESAPNS